MKLFRLWKKNNPENSTDQELLKLYVETQSPEYLGVLHSRYLPLLWGLCLKYLKDEEASKDAVMQIFEKLIPALLKYEIQNFESWLYTFAKNHCLELLKQQKKQQSYFSPLPDNFEDDDQDHSAYFAPTDQQWLEENLQTLEEAIKQLNPDQKICIELFYLQQKSYKEISQTTGFDTNKVKSCIQNGKRNLKLWFEKG